MSTHRYRKLLTNLPSMAAVVNSFQSTDVQLEVYKLLVAGLVEAAGDANGTSAAASASPASSPGGSTDAGTTEGELEQELVDGDSIHSISAEDEDD